MIHINSNTKDNLIGAKVMLTKPGKHSLNYGYKVGAIYTITSINKSEIFDTYIIHSYQHSFYAYELSLISMTNYTGKMTGGIV